MPVTSDDLTFWVKTLTTLLQGQTESIKEMQGNVANLQTTVGGINTAVADLAAKMDQILSASFRNDSAMGVGKDGCVSSADSAARKKIRTADGGAQAPGAAAASASAAA